jgi:hypothetical protein
MIQGVLPVVILVMRAFLAAVLVAAGAAKLADTRSFASTLKGLGVPVGRGFLLRGLALAFPLLEVGVGIAVISGLWPAFIDGIMLVLMMGFSIVVVVALYKKLHVSCRCFGTLSDSQFSVKGLVRSLILTVLAGMVFLSGNVYWPVLNRPSGANILLVAGYLLFALAAAQAAKTIAILKESTA